MRIELFILLQILLTFSQEALPISENKINKDWDKTLFKFMKKNGQEGHFKGANNKRINHFKITGKGKKGAIIFVPGQGEPYIKHFELFYDLLKMGHSPIYTLDLRGQGHSERMLKNPKKGYIDSFDNYIKDFSLFLKKVVLKDKNKNLFLITHSTGGAITLLYLMEDEKRHRMFNKAVFCSPLIKLNTRPFPYAFIKWMTELFCKSKFFCRMYAPGESKFNAYEKFENNPLTSNENRWYQTQRVSKKAGDIWFNGPTIKWVHEVNKIYPRFKNYKGKIKLPFLFLQASDDKVVKPKPQEDFCKKMKGNCKFIRIENSKHEILMEKDLVRNKALRLINHFFNSKL
ncbi:MAG: alpha/beta hydrolase [Bdellovibrionota bacterium]|nr:alpha/beta hydrolase [Bdellovibrionota bacterium]